MIPLTHNILAVVDIRPDWESAEPPKAVKDVEGLQVLWMRDDDFLVAHPETGKIATAASFGKRLVGFTNDGETVGDFLHPKRAERAHRATRFVNVIDPAIELVRKAVP